MTKVKATKEVKNVVVTIVEGSDKLSSFIKSIANRGVKYQQDVHTAACSVLVHVEKHGDIRPAVALIEALPELTRKNALKSWLLDHGKFGYDEEAKVLTFDKSKKILLQDAKNKPFWKYVSKEGVEFKPINFYKMLDALIKRTEKAIEMGQDDIPQSVLNDIKKHSLIQENA